MRRDEAIIGAMNSAGVCEEGGGGRQESEPREAEFRSLQALQPQRLSSWSFLGIIIPGSVCWIWR